MAAMVIIFVALGFFALFLVLVAGVWSGPPKKTPAIENPKYDPEMVKFLAENGLTQQQIIATMERRNEIR